MGKIRNFFAGLWNKASKGALSKGAIIAIAASATVAVAGGVTAGVILNTPEVVAVNAIKGFVKDFGERDEFETVNNMLEKGSMEFSMSELSSDGENVMEDIAVSGKLYFSPKAYMLENMKIESEFININASIYVSEEEMYISEEEILNGTYGGKYTDLAEQLRNEDCIFNPESGSKFAIPEEVFDPLVDALESAGDDQMAKDAEKVIKKYVEKLIDVIVDNAEFESENDEIKVGGERTAVRVVSITITPEIMANIIVDYYEFAAEDDDLVKFLEKYEEDFQVIADNIDDGMTMAEIYEEMIEELEEEVEDLADEMEDMEDDSELIIEIVTPRLSSKLLQLSVKADKERLFTLDVSKEGIKKSNRISISVGDEKDMVVYEIDQNDNKAYKATLSVSDMEVVNIDVNRAKDKFEIAIGPEGETGAISVSGSIKKNGKTTTIGLKSISYSDREWVYDDWGYGNYETVEVEIETDLEIIIKESDKIPAAPKDYTTIDQIKVKDIEDWISKIEDIAG